MCSGRVLLGFCTKGTYSILVPMNNITILEHVSISMQNHLDVCHHFIQEYVEDGTVKIK